MTFAETIRAARPTIRRVYVALVAILVALVAWQPALARDTLVFAVSGLVQVTPIVVPGVLLAAWMMASGAGDRVADLFAGRTLHTVVSATVVGALLPVCGITVLPLMAGLLAAGVPLAPVMAFWLASPITGPAMLAATVATLGWEFAIGKALAAIGLGLLGGLATALFGQRAWAKTPLRSNRLVASLGAPCGAAGSGPAFEPRIWRTAERRQRFARQCWSIGRLIVIVLVPAFAAEFLLNAWLAPDALSAYVGRDNPLAVPLAVIVGGPAYIDGYAALPLTRALIEAGMAPGAAMAFLVSGGVASIWGAMAIVPVLRLTPFLLYLSLAASGSMLSGWAFGLAS
ncbi:MULTISPECIES: permease [unclassified Roseitalea]|uniref:permease n=1 Tax=unclassified Roseitalea TaxID=2639107 RepID=UPI00273ECDB5|nr:MULTISPECIES: permease [unclassified Roseitalea]